MHFFFRWLQKLLQDFFDIGIAIIKVIFMSKFSSKIPGFNRRSMAYLANGPSLNENIDRLVEDNGTDYIMVSNFFYKSTMFQKLKPKFYTICDPDFQYFEIDFIAEFYKELYKIVNWEMLLFVPNFYKKIILKNLKSEGIINENISIVGYNSVNFNGDNPLIYYLFGKKLGIPSPTTVAIPSIMLGIFMGFKKINIVGIDLDMHQNIIVSPENVVKIADSHFYDKNKSRTFSPFYKNTIDKRTFTITETFHTFYKMFLSFDSVRKFAYLKKVKIINYSELSYLDQFEKK
jgi:hypothetical protein